MTKKNPPQRDGKKVFIVDDHPVFREGLLGLLKREPDLQVCGEADNAAQALTGVERPKPDLALVDIARSGLSRSTPVSACAALSASPPDRKGTRLKPRHP